MRVLFGNLEIVFLRLAAAAAFLMFRRAAALCFADPMRRIYLCSWSPASTVRVFWSGANTRLGSQFLEDGGAVVLDRRDDPAFAG